MRNLPPRAFAIASVLLLIVAGTAGAQSTSTGESWTSAELQRLAQGRLVRRPTTRQRGQLRLIGGNAWQVVNRPADEAWNAICNDHAYTQMLPSLDDARVVSHRPGQRVMRFRHSVGLVSAQYHLRLTYDHDRRDLGFRLDRQRPNDLRAAWGFIQVSPYQDDPDRALVSYGVMADIGGGMLGGMFRDQIHDQLLRVPARIRRHLQHR